VAIFGFLKGIAESFLILLRFRPDVAVGFGSLTCIPMILLSKLLGIKTLIHEQNVIPGRANRLMARFSDRIAVSFKETMGYLKDYQKKIALTGNPIRSELKKCGRSESLDFFGLSDNKFTILVMGGSLGSHNINVAFLKSISNFTDKTKLQIIHLTGAKDYEPLKNSYKNLDCIVRLYSFLKPMQYAYSACDIAITRAGATTIAEIMDFRVPAIIIPYPYAYQHQLDNAKVLERIGSAIIIEDSQLQTGILTETLNRLINHPDRLKEMSSCYNKLPVLEANVLLADEVLSLYNK
jgi:UDP-N-acetylglucosamine--N-acetylmuramyl-(pentapeptide) pyrophosphoryl-undecaprenol N-acetylglucosamine transferase